MKISVAMILQTLILRSSLTAAFSVSRRSLSKSARDGRARFLFQKDSFLSKSLASKTELRMTAATEEELEQYKNENKQ